MDNKGLEKKVQAFRSLRLPGQPMAMHMGTANLISELVKEVEDWERACKSLATRLGVAEETLNGLLPKRSSTPS